MASRFFGPQSVVSATIIAASIIGFVAIGYVVVSPVYTKAPFASRPVLPHSSESRTASAGQTVSVPAPSSMASRNAVSPSRAPKVVKLRALAGIELGWFAAAWFLILLSIEGALVIGQDEESVQRARLYQFILASVALGYVAWAVYQVVSNPRLVANEYRIAIAGAVTIFAASASASPASVRAAALRLPLDIGRLLRRPPLWASAAVLCCMFAYKPAAPPYGDPELSTGGFELWYRTQPQQQLPIETDGASVVLVKFNDYQCPPCKAAQQAYEPVMSDLSTRFHGKVKYVMFDYPLSTECNPYVSTDIHPAACEAAVAVRLAAERGNAEAMEKWLWANQSILSPQVVFDAAKQIGGVSDMRSRYQDILVKVRDDIQLGHKCGIRGTPTFLLNGVTLPAVTPTVLEQSILDQINSADHR